MSEGPGVLLGPPDSASGARGGRVVSGDVDDDAEGEGGRETEPLGRSRAPPRGGFAALPVGCGSTLNEGCLDLRPVN